MAEIEGTLYTIGTAAVRMAAAGAALAQGLSRREFEEWWDAQGNIQLPDDAREAYDQLASMKGYKNG